jgi:putative ABC transport system ATP-binding protein
VIQLTDISKTYRMGRVLVRALKHVNLQVAAGEFVGIVGPSGSGKSTLMHVLGLLDTDFEGSYLLDAREVAALSSDALATIRNRQIGFVFQTFNLLPQLSILENVALPALYAGDRAPATCRQQARERLEHLGLGHRLAHRPTELSAGQRQRAAIARALINGPRVLLADEPTGALDSRTAREILEVFRILHGEGMTIVLVTHDPRVAVAAERTIHVLDGAIRQAA